MDSAALLAFPYFQMSGEKNKMEGHPVCLEGHWHLNVSGADSVVGKGSGGISWCCRGQCNLARAAGAAASCQPATWGGESSKVRLQGINKETKLM